MDDVKRVDVAKELVGDHFCEDRGCVLCVLRVVAEERDLLLDWNIEVGRVFGVENERAWKAHDHVLEFYLFAKRAARQLHSLQSLRKEGGEVGCFACGVNLAYDRLHLPPTHASDCTLADLLSDAEELGL